MKKSFINLAVVAGMTIGYVAAAPITIVYFPAPGANIRPNVLPEALPFRLGHAAGLANANFLPPTLQEVKLDALVHEHLVGEWKEGIPMPLHNLPKHAEWDGKAWAPISEAHPGRYRLTNGKTGCHSHEGAHKMTLAHRMRIIGNRFRAMLGLPLIDYHHRPHHQSRPHRPVAHLSQPEDSFFYRLQLAISQLGTWEGRAVSFVLGCGLGVLIRMFVVFGIVLYRSYKGLPLRRGRCCRRGQQQQVQAATDVAEPLLDEKERLPDYSEVVPVMQPEEARYVQINGRMVKAATVVPNDAQFPPPLTENDVWDDTNVSMVSAAIIRDGNRTICWERVDSLSYEETPYDLFKNRCPNSLVTFYEHLDSNQPLEHLPATLPDLPQLVDWETKIHDVDGLCNWENDGMMVCWTPTVGVCIETTPYQLFREKAFNSLLAFYEKGYWHKLSTAGNNM